MAAEIMMGIYFNLSFWYKLIDRTIWGAVFSITGCIVLITVNILFVRHYSYMACAWGGFAGYATCMLFSYFVGQKKNPIPYGLRRIGIYVMLTIVLYGFMEEIPWQGAANTLTRIALLMVYVAYMCHKDFPVGKLVKKVMRR